jgi:sporulation protein YlmC with PRC-barrel domain
MTIKLGTHEQPKVKPGALHSYAGKEREGGPGPWVMGAKTLVGDKVNSAEGDYLGTIEDIMLDTGSGRVAYAVLSFGGVFGLGNKFFAIPWNALELDAENKCFVLRIDKERLQTAPGFDKENWPGMGDATWAYAIHEYYETKPYWAR